MPDAATLPVGFGYRPGFLDSSDADQLLSLIWHNTPWRQDEIFLFGKARLQPRLTAWHADHGVRYAYSGLQLEGSPWQPQVTRLRETLAERLGFRFNSVLLNAYRDGRDSMGWHSDNEPELGHRPVIASVSLGAERRMRIRPVGGGASIGVDLQHGSLMLMEGSSQSQWQHAIPKTRQSKHLRINLTFRLVKMAGKSGAGALS